MKWISFFLAMSALFLNTAFGIYKPNVIYGKDNRTDLYEVQDQNLYHAARSTVAMIPRDSLVRQGAVYKILSTAFGIEFKLCPSERFFNQPAVAMCSGFLVAEDMVATAGHCISETSCDSQAFAFNFAMKSEGQAPQTLDYDDVYFCSAIVSREYTFQQDYALVKLDRPVRGYEPLKLSSAPAKALDEVVVIGHPSGIPTKVSDGAQVRSTNPKYFVSNLDTYGGNSGSAVLNAETQEVLGILVRGERDFQYDYEKQCYRSKICEESECRGEDVTHISYVRNSLESTGVTYLD